LHFYVILGMPPIPQGVKITKIKAILQTKLNTG
jgi:hypothetical protein